MNHNLTLPVDAVTQTFAILAKHGADTRLAGELEVGR